MEKYAAGAGSKGQQFYSWAWVALQPEGTPEDGDTGQHHMLIRRNDTTGELAYHLCYSHTRRRCRCWCAWPVSAGASRSHSKAPRA